MATITVDQYNDDGTTSRTAGEVLTINGGTFTQRTDTRWCSGSPASMTGTYSDILVSATLGGGFTIDATKVRWLAYNSGSSTVPAIGTTVTQGGVSAYLLAVYADLTSAPTAVGAAMPSSGFIKFREVTSGPFTSGALSGIGASATGADVVGWLEVVLDQAAGTDISIPRLGKFISNGDWFYLDDTTGSVGQVLQVPTNGGGANTQCPGVWIETGVGSDTYEFYPGLSTAFANGWTLQHLGSPGLGGVGSDARQKFVKNLGSGQMQIGEDATQSATYTTATQASTYTWSANIVTVTFTAHGRAVGEQVYLDFTSGGATANDGVYTILTVASANVYTVALTGSGTSGNVTATAKTTVTFTAHTLAVGNLVYLNYTSGSGVDGTYRVDTVPNANTFTVSSPWLGSTGGNVTCEYTIGYVPVSGLKVRVPNIFGRQATTAARATNAIPHATIATRPEFLVTSAGDINAQYLYSDWYFSFAQPYSVVLKHSATFDNIAISECATALDLDNVGLGMYSSLDLPAFTCTSNFAGGTVANCVFPRGNVPGTSDHSVAMTYTKNLTFSNCKSGIVQYVRSTGTTWSISTCNEITLSGCTSLNGYVLMATSQNINITNHDHVDRYVGQTNLTTPLNAFSVGAGCVNVFINGVTIGLGGTVANCHPYTGYLTCTGTTNITMRNLGTRSAMISGGEFPLYATGVIFTSGGNNDTINLQRLYVTNETLRTGITSGVVNSDNNFLIESMFSFRNKATTGIAADLTYIPVTLNSTLRGIGQALNTVTPQTSVYGTHWLDLFLSDTAGRLVLCMNEPTSSTSTYATLYVQAAGSGFTSAGGCSLPTLNDYLIIEMPYLIFGHTSFVNTAPTLTGTNTGNHSYEYQIAKGTGSFGSWQTLNGTNLSNESIDPADGFKMKYRITCTTGSSTNLLSFVRIDTNSTSTAQTDNLYSFAVNLPLLITARNAVTGAVVEGARVYLKTDAGGPASADIEIFNTLTNSSGQVSGTYPYLSDQPVSGRVRKASASPLYKSSPFSAEITDNGLDLTVYIIPDD